MHSDISARLTALAKSTKRTKSYFLREALERSLEDLEDAYLVEKAYEVFLKSGKKAIPIEKVEKDLGLAD